jgi:hypothetical protein
MFDTVRNVRLVKQLSRPKAETVKAPTPAGTFTTQQVINLQRGTRGVLVFGIVASVSANVLHSLTRPEAATDPTWKIASAAGLSALAPLVLFACIELVSRIPVQSRWLGGIRLGATFLVGGFAGWVSYWHMESVAETLGETGTAKYFYPLIIDGMMLVATISLIELGRLARTVQTIEALAVVADTEARKLDPEVAEDRAAKARITREWNKYQDLTDSGRAKYRGEHGGAPQRPTHKTTKVVRTPSAPAAVIPQSPGMPPVGELVDAYRS